jgi:hypothetical protein
VLVFDVSMLDFQSKAFIQQMQMMQQMQQQGAPRGAAPGTPAPSVPPVGR